MPNKEEKRITEQSSLYEHLEKMSVDELTAHINAENKKVAVAIEQALPAINQLISAIEGQLKKGGRLFYAGCGTGGRLATLDTIEVQNTYGIDGSQIQAIFPGGIGCLTQTRESREDDLENGWHQLCDKHISEQDFVLGFSASGTTPFVLSILQHCKEAGIPTGCIVNNPHGSYRPGCRLSCRGHHGTGIRNGKYPYESRIFAEDDSGYDQHFPSDKTRTGGRQQDGERQAYQS